MHLVAYIAEGIGLALAAGVRPFLPALLAGLLAVGGVELHLRGSDYAFLQSTAFLVAVAVVLVLSYALAWRLDVSAAVAGLGLGLGAVLFAGVLAAHHETSWPGLAGGVAAAALAQRATGGVFARARARLADRAAREVVVVIADLASVLMAALAIFAWPLAYAGLALAVRMAWAQQRFATQKVAGLRVLR